MSNDIEIENQIEIIKRLVVILKEQVKDIEHKGRTEVSKTQEDENKRSSLIVYYKNNLQLFVDMVDFLVEKLETEKNENFRFYLVHIRTLLDIFAQLLHLLNQEQDKQLTVIVLDTLLTISKLIKHKDSQSLRDEYERYFNVYENFLNELKIAKDPVAFSNTKIEKLGYDFPQMEIMLKEDNLKNSCPQASKIPGLTKSLYGIQSYISNYIHGNHLAAVSYGNENLWIIAKIEEITFAMTDLVDTIILDGVYKYKINTWERYKKKASRDFIIYWKNKSRKIEENLKNVKINL